jgi:hypothetical protein
MLGPSGLEWRRSGRCTSNACAEVAYDGQYVYLRNSHDQCDMLLRFTLGEWKAFLRRAIDGF